VADVRPRPCLQADRTDRSGALAALPLPTHASFGVARRLFWLDAAVNLGMPIPVLLYPGVLLRRWYVPAKQPELMSDAAKQLVLLLWVCAGLVFVIGLMALAAAVSPVGNSGWIYLAFAFYHAAAFMLCFFHVLHADVYGFDVRLNTFWCGYNGALAVCYVIGTLGNVLWFPSKWGEHPEYENSVGGFGGGMN